MNTRTEALDALRNHQIALSNELAQVEQAIAAMSGGNSKPTANQTPPPPAPRAEPVLAEDADQAVIQVLSQQDGLQVRELWTKINEGAEDGEGLTEGQVRSALNRLHKIGRVSKRGQKPAFWSLKLPAAGAETQGDNLPPAPTDSDGSGLTDVEERVLLVLSAQQAIDIKSDVTFGDIEGKYRFEWGDDGLASLSPAVAHLIEAKLVADRLVSEHQHRYRLTVAGQAKVAELPGAARDEDA